MNPKEILELLTKKAEELATSSDQISKNQKELINQLEVTKETLNSLNLNFDKNEIEDFMNKVRANFVNDINSGIKKSLSITAFWQKIMGVLIVLICFSIYFNFVFYKSEQEAINLFIVKNKHKILSNEEAKTIEDIDRWFNEYPKNKEAFNKYRNNK